MISMRSWLLACVVIGAALACMPTEFHVAPAGKAANGTSATSLTQDQVHEAFEGLSAWAGTYSNPAKATFSCVDSRGHAHADGTPTMQTPGGDMAELAAATVVYHRMINTTPSAASVDGILRAFMSQIARPYRPFYFHSSDSGINYALDAFAKSTGLPRPVAMPDVEPEGNHTEKEAWYYALSSSSAQGCGHIKLIMQNPTVYGMTTDAEAHVMADLIKAFFKFWWPTEEGSARRSKVTMPLLQGTLAGRAMAIVKNKGPACPKQEPDLNPYHGGTSLFIYQASAADILRKNVMTPFFVKYAKDTAKHHLDSKAFYEGYTALQAAQTGVTLKMLSPLNSLDIWTVDITSM